MKFSFDKSISRNASVFHVASVQIRALFLVCLVILAGCQPGLWGEPAPPPTVYADIPTVRLSPIPINTESPTIRASATVSPTLPVMDAAQVWISPTIPESLRSLFQNWGFQLVTGERDSSRLYLDLAQTAPGALHVSTWVYVLVAPFPTVADQVTTQELLAAWAGQQFGSFSGFPLLMEASTLATFAEMWGDPAEGAVRIVEAEDVLDLAWESMPSWAIIPFEQIQPKWKVLMVNGQSPVQKSFDPLIYPMTVNYRLNCIESCELPAQPEFSFTNYDPKKLATVILTGVTPMVRATAKTMDVKGILYPGEEIRDMFRQADLVHINNEVPFYGGCPDPDPNQRGLTFCSRPRYIDLLIDIGTDVVELSGDHFADYDVIAMNETLDLYDQVGLPYYGGGRDILEGRKPLLMEINGNKLLFIGCNIKDIYASAREDVPGSVLCDFDYMTSQVAVYRTQGYLPIMTFQYHEFDTMEARPQQILDFRRMADAGAVIVSGSQAHVPQVMEFHQEAFIHYGLGNLFFDQIDKRGPQLTQREFIDRHVFYDGRYLGVELITTFLEDYARPRYMTEAERIRFLTEYFVGSGWDFPQAGQ
jgi:poly-gamma-glutamate synthesis protein (capsule biosynthesis protein)